MTLPAIDATTPTARKRIHGIPIDVPQPWKAGHVLDDETAAVVNRAFTEAFGERVRPAVVEALEQAGGDREKVDTGQLLKAMTQALANFEFEKKRRWPRKSRRQEPREPTEEMAWGLARADVVTIIKTRLRRNTKDYDLKKEADRYFEAHRDDLMTRAAAMIARGEDAALQPKAQPAAQSAEGFSLGTQT